MRGDAERSALLKTRCNVATRLHRVDLESKTNYGPAATIAHNTLAVRATSSGSGQLSALSDQQARAEAIASRSVSSRKTFEICIAMRQVSSIVRRFGVAQAAKVRAATSALISLGLAGRPFSNVFDVPDQSAFRETVLGVPSSKFVVHELQSTAAIAVARIVAWATLRGRGLRRQHLVDRVACVKALDVDFESKVRVVGPKASKLSRIATSGRAAAGCAKKQAIAFAKARACSVHSSLHGSSMSSVRCFQHATRLVHTVCMHVIHFCI